MIIATLVTGLAMGHYQYLYDIETDDEKRPFFDSRIVHTSFWAVFWMLYAHRSQGPAISRR